MIALLSCAILLSKYYQLTCRRVGPGQTACTCVLLCVRLALKILLLLVFHVVCMKSRNNASRSHVLFRCPNTLQSTAMTTARWLDVRWMICCMYGPAIVLARSTQTNSAYVCIAMCSSEDAMIGVRAT